MSDFDRFFATGARLLPCFLLLSTHLAAASRKPAHAEPALTIHVRVANLARISERLRLSALPAVRRIFQAAGIDLQFLDCTAQPLLCAPPAEPWDVWLQILADKPKHIDADSLGFAVLVPSPNFCDSYAAVSLLMVTRAARQMSVPVEDVLAASVAHEIGHVVLQSSAHARAGIMRSRIDLRQAQLMGRADLQFTREEVAAIAAHRFAIVP